MIEMPKATPKNLRDFGLTLAAILGFFAWLSARKSGAAFPYLLNGAGYSFIVALAAPTLFHPIFAVWMRLAGLIATVNTFLLMGVVYYLLFTPSGLVARLFGSDALDEKLGTGTSYWHDRGPVDPKSYERQF